MEGIEDKYLIEFGKEEWLQITTFVMDFVVLIQVFRVDYESRTRLRTCKTGKNSLSCPIYSLNGAILL